jgi:hypothetical protein
MTSLPFLIEELYGPAMAAQGSQWSVIGWVNKIY